MQLRALIADDQSGTRCGGCRATIDRGHRVVGLFYGRLHAMHARCVVNTAGRGGAQAPLFCGARECKVRHGRREALEVAAQANLGLRVNPAGLGERPDHGEDGRRGGFSIPGTRTCWGWQDCSIIFPLMASNSASSLVSKCSRS